LIPIIHFLLMITTGISGAQRIQKIDGVKQFMNFFGIMIYMYLVL
jgi:hypothetical protein